MTCRTEGCEARHCCVCGHRHLAETEPQTCVHCLGRARSDLQRVADTYALLPAELGIISGVDYDRVGGASRETPLPGGDALVMLSPGNHSGWHDAAVELASDPQPPLVTLAGWEDDWRRPGYLGLGAAGPATMTGVTSFLGEHLGWAAQHHPAFDEFATDLRRLRSRLEAVTGSASAVEHGVGCPECSEPLVRRYRDAAPCDHYGPHTLSCDQGGREDDWTCQNRSCGRIRVSSEEYWFAFRKQHEEALHAAG